MLSSYKRSSLPQPPYFSCSLTVFHVYLLHRFPGESFGAVRRKVHEDAVANRWKGKSLLTLYCPLLRFLATHLLIPIPLCVCLASLLKF
jgi:hypothetical protein